MESQTVRIQFKNGSHIRARAVLFVEDPQGIAIRALSPEISEDQYSAVASIAGFSNSRLTANGPVLSSVLFWASDVSSINLK